MTNSEPPTPRVPFPPVVEFLIGNIASGKSSWTRQRAADGWITVNHDSLVRSMHGGDYAWEDQMPGLKTELGLLILSSAARHGRSVVVDNTNRGRPHRAPFLSAARRAGMKVRAVLFPASPPEIHARRRFESDPRGKSFEYWLEVARLIEEESEHPGPDEVDERVVLPEDWRELLSAAQAGAGPADLDRLFPPESGEA